MLEITAISIFIICARSIIPPRISRCSISATFAAITPKILRLLKATHPHVSVALIIAFFNKKVNKPTKIRGLMAEWEDYSALNIYLMKL